MPPICGVCVRAASRYTCPRCELAYCSLGCYQKHGEKCTERFYQDQVEGELRSQRATGEERRFLERMVAQLSRLDEDPLDASGGEDEDEGLSEERLERLAALAERGELRPEDLTPEEARRFHSELKRGALSQALGAWEPWWLTAPIVDLSTLDGDEAAQPAHLCCAGDRRAHPAVALTALEALYAYVHTMRAFNGDWAWDPVQAAVHLLHVGQAICSTRVYDSLADCLHAAVAAAAALPGGGFGCETSCVGDVAALLRRGADSPLRALREAAKLVEAAASTVEGRQGGAQGAPGRLRRGAKKLEFLASFAHHHEEQLAPLADQADAFAEIQRQRAEVAQKAESRRVHGGVAVPSRGE